MTTWTTLASDDFNRADGPSMGSTPVGGYTWLFGYGDCGIASNKPAFDGGGTFAYIDLGARDHSVQFKVDAASFNSVVARDDGAGGTGAAIYLRRDATDLVLQAHYSGGDDDYVTTPTGSVAGKTLRLEAVGDAVEAFVDGASTLTYTIRGGELRTGTHVGMTGDSTRLVDDFLAQSAPPSDYWDVLFDTEVSGGDGSDEPNWRGAWV